MLDRCRCIRGRLLSGVGYGSGSRIGGGGLILRAGRGLYVVGLTYIGRGIGSGIGGGGLILRSRGRVDLPGVMLCEQFSEQRPIVRTGQVSIEVASQRSPRTRAALRMVELRQVHRADEDLAAVVVAAVPFE